MNTKLETLVAEWIEELHTFTHDDADKYIDLVNRTIAALRQADQQSQPVCYVRSDELAKLRHSGPTLGKLCDLPADDRVALFTSPPAQPVVRELTDEEIDLLWLSLSIDGGNGKDFARSVIAADRAIRQEQAIPPNGVQLIAAERQRQISVEGWTPEHDAEHDSGELASAAAAYALNAACLLNPFNGTPIEDTPDMWPWKPSWWKPKDPVSDLTRAGALIAAELDRIAAEENKNV